jgi:HEAT repeat protein
MARQPGESPFRAPITGIGAESSGSRGDDGAFERALLGFCVTALLDRRASEFPGETRAWWAERLRMSKSHVSKMVETPSANFIDRLDLALTEIASDSPVQPDAPGGRRLNPLLSDFYAELRPSERRDASRSVLKWFARYQPRISPQVREVLMQSEIALERCSMLEGRGAAAYDDLVRSSLRELLLVVSGPYGASTMAHHQCAELGLLVPSVFFDALEETLDRSPLGFRVLRTLDRFIKLWRGLGADPNPQRKHEVDTRLTRLLSKLARVGQTFPFIDPYPGAEWGISLARECLLIKGAGSLAFDWLGQTFSDDDYADRARLYAAWVVVRNGPATWRAKALSELSAASASPYLRRWANLIDEIGVGPDEALAGPDSHADQFVRDAFSAELASVRAAVEAHANDPAYRGVRDALESVIFSALVTPDGRLRRALIEAVVNAGLVRPAASVLDELLGIGQGRSGSLSDPGLRETAVFLLGRLRQPSSERVSFLSELITVDRDRPVVHAAVWCLGDIWRSDVDFSGVLEKLLEAANTAPSSATRIGAANVLAIAAHQELQTRSDTTGASAALERISEEGDASNPVGQMVTAIARWGQAYDPDEKLNPSDLLTCFGLIDRQVADQNDFELESKAVGI